MSGWKTTIVAIVAICVTSLTLVDNSWGTALETASITDVTPGGGAKPDLQAYAPPGWTRSIVASSVPGTNAANTLIAGELSYIDWAVQNSGGTFTERFLVELYIDGIMVGSWFAEPMDRGFYTYIEDFEYTLTRGRHTLKLSIDVENTVDEHNENNNSYETTFEWVGATITVSSPNGGEKWSIGSSRTIRWSSNTASDVKIEVSRNGGTSWSTVANNVINTGTYDWTVSSPASENAKIRITSLANSSIRDISNNSFSIKSPTITVTSPNGGEQWAIGSSKTIRWASDAGGNVKIEISLSGGSSWSVIANNVSNSGTYNWTIPANYRPTSNAKIRITSSASRSLVDESDGGFSMISNMDVNGDSRVTMADAIFILEIMSGQRTRATRADLNGDGIIDAKDVLLVLRSLPQSKPVANGNISSISIWNEGIESGSLGEPGGKIYIDGMERVAIGQIVFTYNPYQSTHLQIGGSSANLMVFPHSDRSGEPGQMIVDFLHISGDGSNVDYITWSLLSSGTSGKGNESLQIERSVCYDWQARTYSIREPITLYLKAVPKAFALLQNQPNPFNPETTIHYLLPEATMVRLIVYNVWGQEVRELAREKQGAGPHSIVWNGQNEAGHNVGSGVYFYQLQAGQRQAVGRMLLLR